MFPRSGLSCQVPKSNQAQLAGPWRFGWHLLRYPQIEGPGAWKFRWISRMGEEKVGRERFRRPECTPGRSSLTHPLTHSHWWLPTFTADFGGCSFKRRATRAQHTCPATATMSGRAGTAKARLCTRSPMRREARGLGGAQAQTAQLQWQLNPASGIGIPRQQPTIGQQRLQTCEERLIMLTKCLPHQKHGPVKNNGQNCQCKLHTTMS